MAVEKSCLRKLLLWWGHCLSSPAINVNLGWRGRASYLLPSLPHPSYHPLLKRDDGGEAKKRNRRFTTNRGTEAEANWMGQEGRGLVAPWLGRGFGRPQSIEEKPQSKMEFCDKVQCDLFI